MPPQRQIVRICSALLPDIEPVSFSGVVGPSIFWRPILDIIRILLAFLLPPLGVFLQVGLGLHFWLNILLTLFGWVPGIIHALWVILKK